MRRAATRRLAILAAVSALAAAGGFGVAHAGNFVSESDYDFDCDGVRDLVVADSWDTVNGQAEAGSVTVTYSKSGESVRLTQDTPGVPGSAEHEDFFGDAHAAYDRNSDGCDDLVVGVPREDIGSARDAGMVVFFPGSATGLDPLQSVGHTQNSAGYPGTAEERDAFGSSLAAGATHLGTPYLLIGSPGEGGRGINTFLSGSVYYVRSGAVRVITQDTSGVAGSRETEDRFGATLATSERYFVVGVPHESLRGSVWDEPPSYDDGMIHVFSHTLDDGRPRPIAGVTQDSAGISGGAENGDNFGHSISVLPYRATPNSFVGALVAVGSPFEDVGQVKNAGMAHLLYVSSSGAVQQRAAFTQATSGVTGSPEANDSLGYDTVLADTDPEAPVADTATAAWAVAVRFEETAAGHHGAVHVLPPSWQSPNPDVWLEAGEHGLRQDALLDLRHLRASTTHLHLSGDSICFAVPWKNMLDVSGSDPVVERVDDCR